MPMLVSQCPSCGKTLEAQKLCCTQCQICLEGSFQLGVLAQLRPEQQQFITEFVKASGSLKEMARHFGVSYPTVRNRLDELIAEIQRLEQAGEQHE